MTTTSKHRRHPPSTAGRTLLVLFVCAGIAGLGLLAGGEHRTATARGGGDPMSGYFPPEMPRYPEARELPAGAATRVGASQQRMSLFVTEHEPARVGAFYARHWRSRRLWVRDDVTHRGGVVSAVDEGRGQIYQVLLLRQQGRTMVFPSVTQAPLKVTDKGAEPPVPLFPKSRVLSSLSTGTGEVDADVLLSTNDGGLEANLAHYRHELSAAGYREEQAAMPTSAEKSDHNKPGARRVLVYRHPTGREITVDLTGLGDDRVRVHMVAVR